MSIWGDVSDFFTDIVSWDTNAISQAFTTLPKAVDSFFKGIGGQIAAGLEAAGLAILKDIWDVVIGPLEIALGIILILIALVFAFKDDLFQVAKMFGAVQ